MKKLFITEIIVLATMPLATITFVSAATLKFSNVSNTKNKKNYTAMKNYVCDKKAAQVLKEDVCSNLKKQYQKKPATYNEELFIKNICSTSQAACTEISLNKKYSLLAKKYIPEADEANNTSEILGSSVLDSNNADNPPPNDGAASETGTFFPAFTNYDDYTYPEQRNERTATTVKTDPYIPDDPRITKEMEDMMNNHDQKIRYFADMLISGKNFSKLDFFTDQDFSDQDILDILNLFRKEYGLQPLKFSDKLQQMAKNHALYYEYNYNSLLGLSVFRNIEASDLHGEKPSGLGFTGETPTDRAKFVGYDNLKVSEGIGAEKTKLAGIFRLLYVPLHRLQFLRSDAKEIGFFRNMGTQDEYGVNYSLYDVKPVTVNAGHDTSLPTFPQTLIYPKDGTKLYTYTENIDEFPFPFERPDTAGYEAGYIFTIINQPNGIQYDTITLTDKTTKKELSIQLDNLPRSSIIHFRNTFNSPLERGHEYEISYRDLGNRLISSSFSIAEEDPTRF